MTSCANFQQCRSNNCSNETYKPFIHSKEDRMEKTFRIAEKICAVALGVISAITSFWLFLPAFAVGVAIGAQSKDSHKPNHHHHKTDGSCSIGFIEQATGVRLPDSIALAGGFSVMAVHIDHHPLVFVPIVGVTLGIWAANRIAPSANLCFKRIAAKLA